MAPVTPSARGRLVALLALTWLLAACSDDTTAAPEDTSLTCGASNRRRSSPAPIPIATPPT